MTLRMRLVLFGMLPALLALSLLAGSLWSSGALDAPAARRALWLGLSIAGLGLALTGTLLYRRVAAWLRPLAEAAARLDRALGRDGPLVAAGDPAAIRDGVDALAARVAALGDDMHGRVAAATGELTRRIEAAESASQAKSRFLASASHDLRQPMHAIGLFASALEPHVTTPQGRAILDKIQASVGATESLFSAVLDVSRLDAGSITPQLGRVSVVHLLDRLRDDFQYEAASLGLRFRVRGLSLHASSDPILLDRILRNLVSNALRHTDGGGVLLTARRHAGGIRFQVWDSGIGIPPEHLANIFVEFYQVQTARRAQIKGLGLGLAIVDRLTRLLGHRVEVRSVPGRGSVFSVDVPAADAVDGRARRPAASYARLEGHVLLVDDEVAVLDALSALLQDWGLEVTVARDGAEAQSQLSRPPTLVITDYRLGLNETGLDVVERLRRLFDGEEFPVIVITGDTTGASLQAVAERAYPLLHKPVQPAKLRALVTRLLRR